MSKATPSSTGRKNPSRLRWTPEMLTQLATLYPHHTTREVARLMGIRECQANGQADRLGLKKSAAHLASPASGRTMKGEAKRGMAGRFKPGHTSWNKGRNYQPGGRSKETRFLKGNAPHNTRPLLSERTTKDGYLQIKISETGYPPRDWRGVHLLMWEEQHGPLPKGHALVFRDGDLSNLELANFELITRAELMRRNSIHTRLPPELKHAVVCLGALKRRIRERIERQATTPQEAAP